MGRHGFSWLPSVSLTVAVEQYGALLSMGDCHGGQGDGESGGTGIETSLNGRFRSD